MDKLFIDNTDHVLRIAISSLILYVVVITFIRLSGKRSTSQMNNFDWVVTVAMGSLVASGIILKDVSLIEVILAMGLLFLFQHLITKGIFHSKAVKHLVKAEPRLLVRHGIFLSDPMHEERVTKGEILAAIRGMGIRRTEDVEAVVLETDATLSVIAKSNTDTAKSTSVNNVAGFQEEIEFK